MNNCLKDHKNRENGCENPRFSSDDLLLWPGSAGMTLWKTTGTHRLWLQWLERPREHTVATIALHLNDLPVCYCHRHAVNDCLKDQRLLQWFSERPQVNPHWSELLWLETNTLVLWELVTIKVMTSFWLCERDKICLQCFWKRAKILGSSGIRTRGLSHPKRESYH